jgi:hypothetical protein
MKMESHVCDIVEGKVVIPAVWIVDEEFMVLGHLDAERREIRVIMAIKYKNITVEIIAKKMSLCVVISVRSFEVKS